MPFQRKFTPEPTQGSNDPKRVTMVWVKFIILVPHKAALAGINP